MFEIKKIVFKLAKIKKNVLCLKLFEKIVFEIEKTYQNRFLAMIIQRTIPHMHVFEEQYL